MKPYAFAAHLRPNAYTLALLCTSGEILEVQEHQSQGAPILPELAEAVRLLAAERRVSLLETEGIVLSLPVTVCKDGMTDGCVELGWESFNVERRMSVLTGVRVRAFGPQNQFDLKNCLVQLLKEE